MAPSLAEMREEISLREPVEEHPDCTGKNIEAVKKKWLNFIGAAKPAFRNCMNELTETGKL